MQLSMLLFLLFFVCGPLCWQEQLSPSCKNDLYHGSRRIYLQTSDSEPLCAEYIDVEFDFNVVNNVTTDVSISIFASTNTRWFGIGFPDPSYYYDKTLRKSGLLNGYALVYINGDIDEYNITSTNNVITTMNLQSSQNITSKSIDNSSSTVSINLTRSIDTGDPNDFVFDAESYLDCYPFLMTVAMGGGATFDGTSNDYGSSYVYLYDSSLLANTSAYEQTWSSLIGYTTGTSAFNQKRINISLSMDPVTETVSVVLEDNGGDRRLWGLAFPDLADTAYYADADPINQMADYSLIWGGTYDGNFESACFFPTPFDMPLTEALLPNDGATCDALLGNNGIDGDNHRKCWTELPNRSSVTRNIQNINGVETYSFDIDFKSCGYHFDPYEFQTCRPLTMTLMAGVTTEPCLYQMGTNREATVDGQTISFHHYTDKIQIDDFATRTPTTSPTATPSSAPSLSPTAAPSSAPTDSPVSPTFSPTDPTSAPTMPPTAAPTPRPTDLPTANLTVLDSPDCQGLRVKHLDLLFPQTQSDEEFNQVFANETSKDALISNQRRVWSNGELEIYFTDRFEPIGGGDWIITNETYSAISIIDANADNSLVYNTSDPDAVSPNSLPGPYPFGYVYFDHFPHDNILSKPDQEITLYFACSTTEFPTPAPTPSPTTAEPTSEPTTAVPTSAPTANCTSLCINTVSNDDCGQTESGSSISSLFAGCYSKDDDMNGRAKWDGVGDVTAYSVYYSVLYDKWIVNGDDGYSAWIDGTQTYPPQSSQWAVFESMDPYDADCFVQFNWVCSVTRIPTTQPTSSPTTAIPTTAAPTQDPSAAPSAAPSIAPTSAPSIAPSLAPTSAPIQNCSGFHLTGTDLLDGLYGRNEANLINDRYYWEKIRNGDAKIYWSDSIFHETWIINSPQYDRYWSSETAPDVIPKLINNKWSLYLGASPIAIESRYLELECFATQPPTPSPTDSPTFSPSDAPSKAPSNAPSRSPTSAPSAAPSASPTDSPTTQPPTTEPTLEPTTEPTMEPTPELCPYLVLTNVGPSDVIISEFVGVYLYQNVDEWEKSDSDSGNYYVLSNDGNGMWQIEEMNNANILLSKLQVAGLSDYRPPYFADDWQIDGVSDANYSLSVECSSTDAPSAAPSFSPTLAPSASPTSSCMGLYFNNTDDADFVHNGWYKRNLQYLWNERTHWKSVDGEAEIKFVGTPQLGQWVLLEFDNDDGDDEDPVMLTEFGQNLLSPPSGEWKYFDSAEHNASVVILCDATFAPTEDPTKSPSLMPTEYSMPSWSYCPDDRTYFSFDATSVYWPLPVLNDSHLYPLNVSVTPNVVPGQNNNFELGVHQIKYVATDTVNDAEIECDVEVYVIDASLQESMFEYCQAEKFHIDLKFNDSFIEIDASEIDVDSTGSTEVIQGYVYDPLLIADGQNCYVTVEKVSVYQKVEVDDSPASSTILGFELANFWWEILVCILIAILLCLIVDCILRKCCKKDKETSDEQKESLLKDQHEVNQNEEVVELQEEKPNSGGDDIVDRQETGGQLAEE